MFASILVLAALPAWSAASAVCAGPEDVNCDGTITMGDALVVTNSVNWLRADFANPRADVTGDGFVSASDLLRIVNRFSCRNNQLPTVNAGPDLTAVAGVPVVFDSSQSSDLDGSISAEWDFGDNGDWGVGTHPSHTYPAPGTFVVTLTVTDNCGATATDTIIVDVEENCDDNALPVANAVTSGTATAGQPLSFNGSASHDPEGGVLEFHWTFGDGGSANTAQAQHTYAAAGVYSVTLTVTDECDAINTHTLQVNVQSSGAATADFVINPNPAEILTPVTFTAGAPEALVIRYAWSFSDGKSGVGKSYSRTFPGAANYTATLKVYTKTGQILTRSQTFTVTPGMMLLDIIESDLVNVPRSFVVTREAVGAGEIATVWVVGQVQGVATANVTVPNNAIDLIENNMGGEPLHAAASSSIVAVAAGWGGVYIFDAMQPEQLTPIGHYSTYDDDGSDAHHVALVDDLLYAVCGPELKIIDVSDPSSPTLLARWTSGGWLRRADLVGGRLYVYDTVVSGYRILDISTNPIAPVEVGLLETAALPQDVAISATALVLAEGAGGVEIFDIGELGSVDSPVYRSQRPYGGEGARGVALHGAKLYIANGSRVDKLNVSDLDSPGFIQWVSVGRNTYEMTVVNGHLLVSVSQGVAAVFRP